MVTVCIAGKEGGRVVVLEGLQRSTLVAEIFANCGVLEGAKMVVRCGARLLKVEAGVTTDDIFHVCVGKGGGMPLWAAAADSDTQGIFAIWDTEEAGPGSEQGITEGLERLLHHFSEDVAQIEGALKNLLMTSGDSYQHSIINVYQTAASSLLVCSNRNSIEPFHSFTPERLSPVPGLQVLLLMTKTSWTNNLQVKTRTSWYMLQPCGMNRKCC